MKKRRMKIERKLMAFLLALVMVIGMMPVMSLTVKADGTVEEAEISGWPTSSIAGTVEVTTDNGVTTVKLLKCIKTMNTLTLNSGNCVLDLNGFGIRYASNNTSNGVIMVSNGATLTLSDSSASQQNPNCYFITLDNSGRGISVSNSGTATDTCIEVTGGYITGGIGHSDQWRTRGGGINILETSTVNMTGGTIIGNKSPGQCGGVQIWGGTFTMNDGAKIIRNTSGQGGGVVVTRNGTFNMSGGLIENNTAANRGGGVFVHCSNSYHDNKFNVSGTAVIKDNWVGSGENASANNVYLNADSGFGAKITINGELGNNVPIGMTMAVPGVFTNSTTADYNDISKFTSENEGYMLGKDSQGQLLLGVPVTVNFNDNGYGTAPVSQTVASGGVITKPTNPTAEGYVFCGWYKESECTNAWNFDSDTVTADTTLHAKWEVNTATAPTISGQPQDLILNYGYNDGGSLSVTAAAATDATYKALTYQWYYNTTNSTEGGNAISGATNASYTIPIGENVGTTYYYCVVTAERNDNNHKATQTSNVATVTINKADAASASVTANNRTYDGTEKPLVIVNDATLNGGSMQYSLGTDSASDGNWSETIPNGKTAGTYYVWYKVAGDANHSDYVAEAPIEVNIAQRSIANAAVTLDATEFVYDGTDKTVAVTEVKLEDGSTILSPDTDYTVDGVSGRDKGTYTVTVTATNPNYTGEATAIWSIGLATPVINELPSTRPITYGQPLRDVPLEGGQGGNGENSVPGTFTWKTPDTVPEVSDSETTEYEVIFTPEDTNNYAPVTFRITVIVNKAESPAENPAPTPKEDLIDNGQPQNLINTVPVSGGTIEYVIGTDGSTPPTSGWGPNVPTAAAPGTYYVWYKVVGDNNHQDSVPKCITVTIAGAPAPSDGGNTPSDNSGSNGSGGTSGYVKDVTGTDEAAGNYTFGQSIVNNGDLKTLLSLSDDEVSQGTKVWLDVADLGNNAPESDKALVESAKSDYTIGTYLDINLFKKVGNNEAVKITQTNGKMKVSIVLPESLRAEGRTFAAIRVHHDTAAALPATYDENSHKLSFETDGFSTYAIVYKDGAATGGNTSSNISTSTDNSSSGSNNTTTTTTSTVVPKTDGMSGIMVWSLMLILSLSTLGVVAFMRVKENR